MEPYDYFRDYLYSFLDEDVDAQIAHDEGADITDGATDDEK